MMIAINPMTAKVQDLQSVLVAQATLSGLKGELIRLEPAQGSQNIGTCSVLGVTKTGEIVRERFTFQRDGMCLHGFPDSYQNVPWEEAIPLIIKSFSSYLEHVKNISPAQNPRAQAQLSPTRPTPGSY